MRVSGGCFGFIASIEFVAVKENRTPRVEGIY